MTDALLKVDDLGVIFPGRGRNTRPKVALHDVSLRIEPGETLGLVGESGSGKSTLGNAVLGLVTPTSGRITFAGRDITALPRAARRELSRDIQVVFQDPQSSFNPNRTIGDTVGETLSALRSISSTQRTARVAAMLERVGLDASAAARYPAQFSGGQRQRIAIARALLPAPRLVICDEAVSALDLSVQAQVLNLLIELQEDTGVAYLFITHDMAVVSHISHRIAVLRHGELMEAGEAATLIEHPTTPYTRGLLDASPFADPVLQDARRLTRRALARVSQDADNGTSNSSDDLDPAAVAALRDTLAHQSAVEIIRQSAVVPTTLRKAAERVDYARDSHELADFLSALLHRLLESSGRTDPAALPECVGAAVSVACTVQPDSVGTDPRPWAAAADRLIASLTARDSGGAVESVDALLDAVAGRRPSVASTP